MDLSDPSKIKDFLLNEAHQPLVFKKMLHSWPAVSWSPESLASKFGYKITFRLGRMSYDNIKEVLWETKCDYIEATFHDFCEWKTGDAKPDNPFHSYPASQFWAYADYKHFPEIFSATPDICKEVQWKHFGFDGRDGNSSTFWLGSTGAFTPCHLDTYGCNLVAQIYGRKRWILFPPDQSEFLYATRIPYEESSIFSRVNVKNPDFDKFPLFSKTSPFAVTLEPGDVLFVPRHWWHYVESLETSISVNTWIELPADDQSRLHEAISRLLITSLMESDQSIELDDWLNPTENSHPYSENLQFLNQAFSSSMNSRSQYTRGATQPKSYKRKICDSTCVDSKTKIPCVSCGHRESSDIYQDTASIYDAGPCMLNVEQLTFKQYIESLNDSHISFSELKAEGVCSLNKPGNDGSSCHDEKSNGVKYLSTSSLVHALLNPKVVSLVETLLIENNQGSC